MAFTLASRIKDKLDSASKQPGTGKSSRSKSPKTGKSSKKQDEISEATPADHPPARDKKALTLRFIKYLELLKDGISEEKNFKNDSWEGG